MYSFQVSITKISHFKHITNQPIQDFSKNLRALHHIKNNLLKLCKELCRENFNILLVFNSFKLKKYFSYKIPISNDLKSFLVYKLTCASCSSSYIGQSCCHFKTKIQEDIKKDSKSHIFKNLHFTTTCFDSYNSVLK